VNEIENGQLKGKVDEGGWKGKKKVEKKKKIGAGKGRR